MNNDEQLFKDQPLTLEEVLQPTVQDEPQLVDGEANDKD